MSVGFLGTLMARLTAARAARLDNLDLKLSTNMPSKAYYTDARGGKIDKLDESISTRASASALATTDAACDAIRNKTDAYLNSSVAGVKTVVDAVQLKTDTIIAQHRQAWNGTSGTWTKPPGVYFVDIKICGAGANGNKGGVGGGGAQVVICRIAVTSNLEVVTGAHGSPGGDSTIIGTSVNILARGGQLNSTSSGGSNAVSCVGGAGGSATGANGDDCYGLGIGGAGGGGNSGGGGGSWGDGGRGGTSATAGGYGAGGGGSPSAYTPGAGGNGFATITWGA